MRLAARHPGALFSLVFAAGLLGVALIALPAALVRAFEVEHKLVAFEPAEGDIFGSVAISGDTALVGAFHDDHDLGENAGAAYVFTRDAEGWVPDQMLTAASDGQAGDEFGVSVAVDGDLAVVGAPGHDYQGDVPDAGAAYVFAPNVDGTWVQEAQLSPADGQPLDHFGLRVAISGTTIVVGAPGHDVEASENAGVAYVFAQTDPGVWIEDDQLFASDAGLGTDQAFGDAVAISGSTAVVGAPLDDVGASEDSGSAYVFSFTVGGWDQEDKLIAADNAAGDEFGSRVAISGDTALIGAQYHDLSLDLEDAGAAYVFVRGDPWVQEQKLTASDVSPGAFYGYGVALQGDTAMVGAPGALDETFGDVGAAYLLRLADGVWQESDRLSPSDGLGADAFGTQVAMSGERAIVGAPGHEGGGFSSAGAAYVYEAASDPIERVSVDSDENEVFADPTFEPVTLLPDISDDGQTVAFHSRSAELVSDDTNDLLDVFVRSRDTGETTRVSVASDGAQGNGHSADPAISADGSTVVFTSGATNLDVDDNGEEDTFVHDLVTGVTELVSLGPDGVQGDGPSLRRPDISADGSIVAFSSDASTLVDGDGNGVTDVFVRDWVDGPAERVSVHSDGTEGNSPSFDVSISGDGRFVVFSSLATNLVDGDANGVSDIFMHDRNTSTTTRLSMAAGGDVEADGASTLPVISQDGTVVAFDSDATNIVEGDSNERNDVFVLVLETGEYIRVSVSSFGDQADGGSGIASVSGDGQVVSFLSSASNLVERPTSGAGDIFVHDRGEGTTELVTAATDGGATDDASLSSALSGDGRFVAFDSLASNLVLEDTNGIRDAFVRDRAVELSAAPSGLTATASLSTGSEGDTVEAGAAVVNIADIDPQAIPLNFGAVESAPLRNIDLSTSPLRNIPLRNIPLRNIGLLGDPLDGVLLSSIPLKTAGGWEAVLEGTALQGVPLQSVSLQDVLELNPLPEELGPPAAGVDPVTLEEIDLSASPLRNIGMASIALGATPLRNIPLQPDPAAPNAPTEWCPFLATLGFDCNALGVDDGSTMLALDIAGVPLRNIPLRNIPLRNIDLTDAPLRNIELADISIDASPLRNIPLNEIAVQGSPLRNIPLRNIPLRNIPNEPEPSPLRNIPLSQIPACTSIFDTSRVSCAANSADTLGTAADLEPTAILPAAEVEHIAELLEGYTLGDLNFYADITLGDIYEDFPDEVTLAGVLIALLDALDYPWEELPLEEMGVQDFASEGGVIEYIVDFELNGGGSTASANVTVELPPGFRLSPTGTPELSGELGIAAVAPVEPIVDGNQLRFELTGLSTDSPYELTFDVRPGLRLGPFEATATVEPIGGTGSAPDSNQVEVVETLESNDSPATAREIEEGALYVSYITSPDDLDFFRIPVPPPGSRLSVQLSHLADDNDLVVYSPQGSTLRAASPRSIGLQGNAVEDPGVDLNTLGDQLAPETIQDIPLELPNVASISASRSTEGEEVDLTSSGDVGFYTIQVSGYNGATSDKPYVLRVDVDDPIALPLCSPRSLPTSGGEAGIMPALPTTLETIFLIHQERFGDTFGAADPSNVLRALDVLAARNDVNGAVIPVESNAAVASAYATWDLNPCSPATANAVVNAIGALIDSVRQQRPSLKHVVIVGGDDIIPMARVPDLTRLANERDYAATFGETNNQYLGALATEHILSDDPYVDFDPIPFLDRHLFVPDLALGRLVETPDDVVAAIENFIAFNGSLDPQTALTTGYDFLSDGAADVASAIDAATGKSGDTMISETWTASDLAGKFLAADSPDVSSINAHYDHNRALPGFGNHKNDETDLFTTTHVSNAGADHVGQVLFTMGCHAGLSVSDVVVGVPSATDWAQTYASEGAAAYAGSTGFAYGDTAANAYSERLMTLLAERLDGTMTIGQALTFAKQEYFARLAVVGVYDEKVLSEAAFYGLPMYRIGTAAPPSAPPPAPPTFTDPITGLEAAALELQPEFTAVSTGIGDYYEASLEGSAADVQVTHYRPIQPRVEVDVTQASAVAHDALIVGLTQLPDEQRNGAFSRPIVDLTAHEPETTFREAIFPSRLQSLVTYNDPDGQRQRLVIVPGQFFTDPDAPGEPGVQRRFSEVDALVMYTPPGSADFVRPQVRQATATTVGSTVNFEVRADDPRATGGPDAITRALVLFHHDGNPEVWTAVDLVRGDGTNVWTGLAPIVDANGDPVVDAEIEYSVQVVDADGNVGVSSNKGRYFDAVDGGTPAPDSGITVSGDQGEAGWYLGDVTVTVGGGGQYIIDDGDPKVIDGSSFEVTGDGVHTVEVIQGGETLAIFVVPIDKTAPLIEINTPPDGAFYDPGQVVVANYRCVDALSGAVSCVGTVADGAPIQTSTDGHRSFMVSATDAAGNVAEPVTHRYEVGDGFNTFLLIDGGSLGGGIQFDASPNADIHFDGQDITTSTTTRFTRRDVNEDRPGQRQRAVLRYFNDHPGEIITVMTGSSGDETWFAPNRIPSNWCSPACATPQVGIANFVGANGSANIPAQTRLATVPDVRPLRAAGLHLLEGETVCAVVYDGELSLNYRSESPRISASLKGNTVGIVAFTVQVDGVHRLSGFSSSTLPEVRIKIENATQVCGGTPSEPLMLSLFGAPAPASSSVPMDVDPHAAPPAGSYPAP